jgi:hypothetical protein
MLNSETIGYRDYKTIDIDLYNEANLRGPKPEDLLDEKDPEDYDKSKFFKDIVVNMMNNIS